MIQITFIVIKRELAILRNQLIIQGINSNEALNQARKAMNDKYGKGWREKEWREKDILFKKPIKTKLPSIYDDHTHGEHWMD